jgi:hypothetical protein
LQIFSQKKSKKMQGEGAGNQIALQKKKDKMSGSDPDARDKDIRSTFLPPILASRLCLAVHAFTFSHILVPW